MQRPTKKREAVRILVIADEEILLQGDTDPGVPDSAWWVTPGGGIDDGESAEEAAVRELFEETGLIIEPTALRGPVAMRTVRHGYSDRVLIQHETFFRVDVERFTPNPQGLTETEQERMRGHGWFSTDLLPDELWPATLRTLIAWDGTDPLDLGWMDESTVD